MAWSGELVSIHGGIQVGKGEIFGRTNLKLGAFFFNSSAPKFLYESSGGVEIQSEWVHTRKEQCSRWKIDFMRVNNNY